MNVHVITNPRRAGNPVVFVADAFAQFTGYDVSDFIGHRVDFLQGEQKSQEAIRRMALVNGKNTRVDITVLNYKKSGEPFIHHFRVRGVVVGGEVIYHVGEHLWLGGGELEALTFTLREADHGIEREDAEEATMVITSIM